MVSFGLGLALGVLIVPLVLASEVDQTQKDEWCLYYQFDSLDHYEQTDPPADTVFIKMNGRKAQVHVKC